VKKQPLPRSVFCAMWWMRNAEMLGVLLSSGLWFGFWDGGHTVISSPAVIIVVGVLWEFGTSAA